MSPLAFLEKPYSLDEGSEGLRKDNPSNPCGDRVEVCAVSPPHHGVTPVGQSTIMVLLLLVNLPSCGIGQLNVWYRVPQWVVWELLTLDYRILAPSAYIVPGSVVSPPNRITAMDGNMEWKVSRKDEEGMV